MTDTISIEVRLREVIDMDIERLKYTSIEDWVMDQDFTGLIEWEIL